MLIFIKYVNLIRINFENNENYILIVKHTIDPQLKHFQSNIKTMKNRNVSIQFSKAI